MVANNNFGQSRRYSHRASEAKVTTFDSLIAQFLLPQQVLSVNVLLPGAIPTEKLSLHSARKASQLFGAMKITRLPSPKTAEFIILGAPALAFTEQTLST